MWFVEVQDSLPVRDDDLGYLLSDPNLHEYETLDDPLIEEDGVSPDIEVNDASNGEAVVPVVDDYYLRPDTSACYANDLIFDGKPEAKKWLQERAKENMCVVVQNSSVKATRMEMVCERSGWKKSHEGKNNKYVRKSKKKKYRCHTKKIGCPFKIVFYKPGGKESKPWKMSKIVNGCHNHDDPDNLEGHYMFAKLKPNEMETVKTMCIHKASAILSKIKADNPDNLSSLSTIKAALAKIKKTEWDGRTVMQQSQWLAEKHNYTLRTEEKDGKVLRIFMAHPEMIKLAQCFHQILLIDATYNTNKYNMPLLNMACHTSDKCTFTIAWGLMDHENNVSYVWMLKTLRSIYNGNDFPRVIVTDNDARLMHAIAVVFPEARNLQCTWHIQCNIKLNCHLHFQAKKPRKGAKRSPEEDERLSKLTKEQQEEEKRLFDEKWTEDGMIWRAFMRAWDKIVWSITEEKYERNLKKFEDEYGKDYPKAVEYCKTNWLTIKERFVYAWTYDFPNFKNEATSIAEGSHGKLKKILVGSQNGVVSVQEAIHEYTNRDLTKIKAAMQFSQHKFPTEHEEERLFLRGIVHKVSKWAIDHMMEQLEFYKKYDDENTVCVCKDMIGIGLPCRHKLGRYKEVINVNDIHPFWKQLNFTPSTPIVDGPTWMESELCARIAERYATANGCKKQILMHDLEQALHPQLREVDEPIKQKGTGRPSTEVSRTVDRKILKEYELFELSNKRIKCRHERSEADFEDEPEPKRVGRPRKNPNGPTTRQVRANVTTDLSQVSRTEAVEEVALMESQTSSVVIDGMSDSQQTQSTEMVTIKEKYGTLRCPRDLQGRPTRSRYTLIEEYMDQLPPIIVPFVLSTDEVDGDGNCGFHVASEQSGNFGDVISWEDLRSKMAVQLAKDKDFYMEQIKEGDRYQREMDFKDFVARVKCRKGLKTIGRKYWMTMPKCRYLLADTLSCVVHLFVPPKYGLCLTFTPTRTVCDESVKDRRIVMAFVNDYHFIGLRVKRDCPLPPLGGHNGYFATNYCNDWLKQYETNMLDWDRVMSISLPKGLLEMVSSDDED